MVRGFKNCGIKESWTKAGQKGSMCTYDVRADSAAEYLGQ